MKNTEFSQEKADIVCDKVMEGWSLRKIEAETGVRRAWVLKWLRENAGFERQYAYAKEEQAELFAEEIMELADATPAMALTKYGREVVDSGWVTHQKNRVDARKWIASKLRPRKYGDSTNLKHSDADGGKLNFIDKLEVALAAEPRGLPVSKTD